MAGYHRVHKHASSLRVASRILSNLAITQVLCMEQDFNEIKNSDVRCMPTCAMYKELVCSSLGREIFPGSSCEAQRISRVERE